MTKRAGNSLAWAGLVTGKRSYCHGGLSYTVPILTVSYGFVVMTH
jgi:hypothetical protein